MLNKQKITGFHRRLQRWYGEHGRKQLPWRHTRDPYAIYISEIMLQQTQVVTVQSRFYEPFLARFPSLSALAAASPQKVMKAWQGLGYYSRARHLHEAARRCGGTLPDTPEGLMALPGIGRNTAHAICAFAHGMPLPVMEANVKRVLCRIFALREANENRLWELAATLLNSRNPFDYNQAMMDLGAMVCTKRAPSCDSCPAGAICSGRHSPEHYPAKKSKKSVPVRKERILVQRNTDGEYFATPRRTRFLGGLYHFGTMAQEAGRAKLLGHIRQQYSHFTLEAEVYIAESDGSGPHWHSMDRLRTLPMSKAEQKIVEML